MEDNRARSRTVRDRPLKLGRLERLGPEGRDVMVFGLDAPTFNDLPTGKKVLAYYLYRAAIAGDAIMYAQNHRHALEIKQLLESILQYSHGMSPDLRDDVHDYLKYIWIHHGNYHHSTHTKFLPNRLTPDRLREATAAAVASGALPKGRGGEALGDLLRRVERTIFDAEYEPLLSNAHDGVDGVATSAVNFYDEGVTQADVEALGPEWTRKINVRFARQDDRIVPETFKIGGVYGKDLAAVSHFLALAMPHAETDEQQTSLELLLAYYGTGSEERFRDHSVHWLKSDSTIDYLNGFIEQYLDPRGVIANFEGNVSYAIDNPLLARISSNAQYFEDRMPWPDAYKRSRVEPPVAKIVDVVVETGDAGPVSPAAYNLPNYNDIRRDHGSKNVILWNVENSRSPEMHRKIIEEFYLPEYRENMLRYALPIVRPLHVYLHEIIGHGSGQPDASLGSDPRNALGRLYSPLEETRADLVALYHLADPKLVELGAFRAEEHRDILETAYVGYTQGWMARYDRVARYEVREAHNRAHQLILMYLVQNGGDAGGDFGVDVIQRDGDFYVRVRDVGKVRRGIAELLGKVQVIKSTGDAAGASALLDRYASRVEPAWHDNMIARLERLNIPKLKAFVFPRLEPVLTQGRVVDVNLFNDEDLTQQHLRYSRLRGSTDVAAG